VRKIVVFSFVLIVGLVSIVFNKQSSQKLSYRFPATEGINCAQAIKSFLNFPKSVFRKSIDGLITKSQVHISGESGFFKKVSLIESAKPGSVLHLAYFIVEDDYSSSFLVKKLIEASERGVKVELLTDYVMSDKYLTWLQFIASHNGISVKRFRPPTREFSDFLTKNLQMKDVDSFFKGLMQQNSNLLLQAMLSSDSLRPILESQMKTIASIKALKASGKLTGEQENTIVFGVLQNLLMDKSNLQTVASLGQLSDYLTTFFRRMHHKILISNTSEGKEFIVGGRNISDEYHLSANELDTTQNLLKGRSYPFIDSEISGVFSPAPGERELENTFADLWNSTLAQNVNVKTLEPSKRTEMKESMEFKSQVFNENQARLRERAKSGVIKLDGFSENSFPAKYLENNYLSNVKEKEILHAWVQSIEGATKKVEIVSAYLYLYPELISALKKAGNNGAKISIYTNSSVTTDLSIVNIGAYQEMKKWKEEIPGVKFFELDVLPGKGSLHAKIINVDNNFVGIGSANKDLRTFLYDTNNFKISPILNLMLVDVKTVCDFNQL
jgi:phosphatidylserine/phosphatidylglycerophosphate/cardiolipin synthase-like enzyme